MYNNPYEEYMRNSLGYNMNSMMNMNMGMNQTSPMMEMYETEGNFTCDQTSVDDMYPEIYRIVYPMICKACMAVSENVTEDLVSRITNEVYVNVENMELSQENRSSTITVQPSTNKSIKNESLIKTSSNSVQNVRQQETRQRNPLLRDLIRILVLRELIGNPGRPPRPPRPPFNSMPRPPFGPGHRPPFGF